MLSSLIIKDLGLTSYTSSLKAMQDFNKLRSGDTEDELWILEHHSVFTQGLAGKAEHVLDLKGIPLVQSDRGGQVTYHGPGQMIAYCLLDLKRLNLGPKALVSRLEQAVIQFLGDHGLESEACPSARGVYIKGAKIASLGLRIQRGCCYHGLALNVCMDLTPFQYIHPCGYSGLSMTQLQDWVPSVTLTEVRVQMKKYLTQALGYHYDS